MLVGAAGHARHRGADMTGGTDSATGGSRSDAVIARIIIVPLP
jgi:hypothetical protein